MRRSSIAVTLIAINVYAFAISFLWNTLHPLVMPYLISQFEPHFKNTFLGMITTAGLVVATVVQPLAGGISDRARTRWGRRRPFILVGTLFDVVFLAMIALAGNYWFLFVAYCLLQTSSNVAHGPYQGFIPDLVPDKNKGLASGIKSLVELIALVLGSAIIGMLLGNGQLTLSLAIMGALLVITMLMTLVLVHEETPTARGPTAPAMPPLSLAHVVSSLRQHSTFGWYILSRFLVLAGLAAVRTFAQNYIEDVLHATNPAALAGQLMTVLGVAVLIVVLPAGYLADRVGRKRLNVLSALLGACGTALLLGVGSYTQLVVFGAIVGVAVGIFMSANWALAMDLLPAGEAALFLGLTNLATAGSGAAAGLLGPLIDALNRSSAGLGYSALFAAAAVMWLAGGLILARLPIRR